MVTDPAIRQQILTDCQDYTALRRSPNNHWTSNQRVVLAFLVLSYDNTWTQFAKIFNQYFEEELHSSHGLSGGALSSMHHSTELLANEKAAVAALQSSSSSPKSVGFEGAVIALIKRSASDLGIQLVDKEPGAISKATTGTKSRKPVRRKRKATDLNGPMSDDTMFDNSDCELVSQSSSKRFCTHPVKTPEKKSKIGNMGLLSPPPTAKTKGHNQRTPIPSRPKALPRFGQQAHSLGYQDAYGSETSDSVDGFPSPTPPGFRDVHMSPNDTAMLGQKRLPRLAFRTFCPNSMGVNTPDLFVAGSFIGVDPDTIPPPPDPRDPDYRTEAMRHVAKVYSGTTQLISTSRNLLRCLHRALKSEATSSIAVIDLHVLDSLNLVQGASALKLQTRHKYVPAGEYLVYGHIPAKAIVSCVATSKLRQLMPKTPGHDDPFQMRAIAAAERVANARTVIYKDPLKMSHHAGVAVGEREAVYSITTDWKVEQARKWQGNKVFCGGVEQGYRSRQSGRFMSLDDEEMVNYTDVEQSDEEHGQEFHRLSQEAIDDPEFGDPQRSDVDETFTDDFITELDGALEDTSPDPKMANLNYPFRSVFDIPRVKIKEEATTAENAGEDDMALEEGKGDQDIGNDIVNQLCGFAETQCQGNEDGASEQDCEESYDHSWTGM